MKHHPPWRNPIVPRHPPILPAIFPPVNNWTYPLKKGDKSNFRKKKIIELQLTPTSSNTEGGHWYLPDSYG
jgi:hypothetical protein